MRIYVYSVYYSRASSRFCVASLVVRTILMENNIISNGRVWFDDTDGGTKVGETLFCEQ